MHDGQQPQCEKANREVRTKPDEFSKIGRPGLLSLRLSLGTLRGVDEVVLGDATALGVAGTCGVDAPDLATCGVDVPDLATLFTATSTPLNT